MRRRGPVPATAQPAAPCPGRTTENGREGRLTPRGSRPSPMARQREGRGLGPLLGGGWPRRPSSLRVSSHPCGLHWPAHPRQLARLRDPDGGHTARGLWSGRGRGPRGREETREGGRGCESRRASCVRPRRVPSPLTDGLCQFYQSITNHPTA